MSAYRTPIHRINLQGRNFPLQLPPPGLSNKRIRSRLRAIYPYSLGILHHHECKSDGHCDKEDGRAEATAAGARTSRLEISSRRRE